MDFNERDVKKILILGVVVLLGLLTFFVIRPVLTAVIWALLLAYLFMPLYNYLSKIIKNKTTRSLLVTFILVLIIILPLWFLIPLIIPQMAELLRFAQVIDVQTLIKSVFPTTSDQFARQMGAALDGFISNIGRVGLEKVTAALIELPQILLQLFIVGFVFFFALRDNEHLRAFVAGISPFSQSKEKILVKHFKDITDSVIFGQVIIGLVQGALAGIGFVIFGINNALVLTILATLFAIAPIIGPYIIWIPVAIYMFATEPTSIALTYTLYNAIIVSTVDNILRSYLISRKTDISPAIIFIGMIGGFFIFGVTGLILGPLILAYFLVFLQSYKEKNLYSLFSDRNAHDQKK